MSKIKVTTRICFDLFLLVLLFAAEYWVHFHMKPFKRGFFCGDESLQYPFRKDTFSETLLLSTAFAFPSLVIICLEFLRCLPMDVSERKKLTKSKSNYNLKYRFVQCYYKLIYYFFGLISTFLLSSISKNCIGRLRPHFFAACQPKLADGSNCESPFNQGHYIEEYTCTGSNASKQNDVHISFPSAHSSVLFYAMLYVAIYLQSAMATHSSKLLKHTLQFICIMFAWYGALSRVSDYWHHWSDVLAGALLGAIVALIATVYMANMFSDVSFARTKKPHSKANLAPSSIAAITTRPTYSFGTIPYPMHPHAHQYGQTYSNYGYVP